MNDPEADTIATEKDAKFTAEEGLRLIRAFMRIKNPEDRARLIEQAEALSRN
ncbi:MAG: hypothetical protein HYX37_11710 [Rhizobiales bacterium]|nr:hypothetical protein [Hyphomicrobiales bacterium]